MTDPYYHCRQLLAAKDRVILALAEKLAICSAKLSELSERPEVRHAQAAAQPAREGQNRPLSWTWPGA